MELKDICGKRILQGIDRKDYKRTEYGEEITSDAVWFRLDNVTYLAAEDPDDGYRSMCEEIVIVDEIPRFKIPDVPVFCEMKPNGRFEDNEILVIRDANNGKVVLEIGTDYLDIYYPAFVCEYHPENLSCNEGKQP